MTDTPSYNPAHAHELHPPRALLMALGALVLFTLIGVGFARLGGFGLKTDWRALSVEALAIIVEDGTDGSVIVRDPASGALVRAWEPDTGGFVRTAMRSLALERRQLGIGSTPAFVLHRTANERLILEDPQTGKWVSLDAFGADNAAEFAKLLTPGEATP